ncbi:MAG: magnesium transporter [Actinomycetota bacterium]|nr:magnesium transporter [Acidimicrobiia bacterium]MDQ3147736.1 magnesium transporter [Actinomycetota bacterium]
MLRKLRRLRRLLGPDPDAARQGLAALGVALVASFFAGLTLGSIEGTLEELPGLLVLIPAAIGMRGTIFGALGSRLSTAIHTGTFGLARRADTVVGQNVLASAALSLSTAFALAILAKLVAVAFGLGGTITVPELVVISVLAGVASSAVVLVLTVALAAWSVRAGWDSDNVLAPVITAAGDMVTLPALFLASLVIGLRPLTVPLAVLLAAASLAIPVVALRSSLTLLKRIVVESFPVVLAAGVLDLVAGLTIEKRLSSFTAFPALLVLIPPFLAASGALGGILSSRLSSALHLGVISPTAVPSRPARVNIALTFVLALPLFVLCSVVADAGSAVTGLASPGALRLLGVTMVGGTVATCFVVVVAYYGTIVAVRLGLDPDTYGIPVVTSSVDLVGAFALILGILALGLG